MTVSLPTDLLSAYASSAPLAAAGAVSRIRDLVLTRQGDLVTVIACDVNAGIGDMPGDRLTQNGRDTGFGAAKVPLMEVMAAGATPIILINTLGLDRTSPAGEAILRGIDDCVALTGHRPVITGSDETNVATTQTSVGVVVIGVARHDELRLRNAVAGDDVYVVGTPKDGLRVPYSESDVDVATPRDVAALVKLEAAHEVLPVGSRGVALEAIDLATVAGLELDLAAEPDVDVTMSAGSSTCVLVAAPPGARSAIATVTGTPVTMVGRLHAATSPLR